MRRLGATVAAVVVAAAALWFVFTQYLPSFVTSARPVPLSACARADTPPVAAEGRLLVVIVDGLGFDFAQALPDLAWLREAGATRPLDVPYPSYTTPALLSFVTGLGPRDSGVRLNAALDGITTGMDNLAQVARDAGMPFRLLDGGEWAPFEHVVFSPGQVEHGPITRSVALFRPAERSIVYYGRVDAEGHRTGAASPEYRAEAERAARFLYRAASGLDLSRDVLLAVSDHGHLADGGHGGVEPEIRRAYFAAIGAGIAPGERASRPLGDVAATIAMLAGIATPGCNLGFPMHDILDRDAAAKARAVAGAFAQVTALACALDAHPRCDEREGTTGRLARGDGSALSMAEDLARALTAAHDAALDAAQARARGRRQALFAALVIALAAAAGWQRRRFGGLFEAKTWLAPLCLVASYALLLYARGYRLTFSKMPQQEDFLPEAAIAATVAAALTTYLALWILRARDADLATLAGTMLPWLALVVHCGADPSFVVPADAGLAIFLLGPGVLGAVLATIAIAWLMPLVPSPSGISGTSGSGGKSSS